MPEAVALAEILCDPQWRRHVATADHHDLLQLYRQVARRLGQPTKFSDRLAYSYRIDPLKPGSSSTANSSAPSATSSGDSVPTTPSTHGFPRHPSDKPPHSMRHDDT
jgi:hypothetical protein